MDYKGLIYESILSPGIFEGDMSMIARQKGFKDLEEAIADSQYIYSHRKHDPFLMEDMDKLVERVLWHIQEGNNIMIFGDYDVDGISATAVMVKGLLYLGLPEEQLQVIIPNRVIGYSINKEYIIEHLENGGIKPDLIITVDCGIRNVSDVAYIVEELGIETIITDHHGVNDDDLPLAASALVNPHRRNSAYPFQDISGSLVALKVIEALETKIPFVTGPNNVPNFAFAELEELAVLGTIADVMPIQNENLWLSREALPRLSRSKNTGLMVFSNSLKKQFSESSEDNDYNTDFIGWSLGPRINAAGRIANPYLGLKILLTNDKQEADKIFLSLDGINTERQGIVKENYASAVTDMENVSSNNRGIVYINKDITDGVIGLIAGRLKEDYYLPTICLGAEQDGTYKGSCRSIEGFNIYQALVAMNEKYIAEVSKDPDEPLMLGFGGHPLAAGLSIREENIDIFVQYFYEQCDAIVTDEMRKREFESFGTITDFSTVSLDTIRALKTFGPFGQANAEPYFLFVGTINEIAFLGKRQKTLRIELRDRHGHTLPFIMFRYDYNTSLKEGFEFLIENNYKEEIALLGRLKANYYRGETSLQIQIADLVFLTT